MMFSQDTFARVRRAENIKMAAVIQFLKENDLSLDTSVDVFITVSRNNKLIACGGFPAILLNVSPSAHPFAVKGSR
jgi:Citrate lyase synthetase